MTLSLFLGNGFPSLSETLPIIFCVLFFSPPAHSPILVLSHYWPQLSVDPLCQWGGSLDHINMSYWPLGHSPLLGAFEKRRRGERDESFVSALADTECHLLWEGGRKPTGYWVHSLV